MRLAFAVVTSMLLPWLPVPVANAEEVGRRVSVSAQSEITVEPDEALVLFSVQIEDLDLVTAKRDNDAVTAAALRVAEEQQIPQDQLKILDFELSPQYDREGLRQGYFVSRSFEVRIHAFEKIEPLIYGLIESGVQRIDRVKFQVKDQRRHQMEARRLAFVYAQEKASHLAELSNLKLGPVVSLTEDVQYNEEAGGGGGFGGGGFFGRAVGPRKPDRIASQPQPGRPAAGDFQFVAFPQQPRGGANEARSGFTSPGLVRLNATVSVEFELVVP